jgi:hypothetical protein
VVESNILTAKIIDGEKWRNNFSDMAHEVCFGTSERSRIDAIDFAVLGFVGQDLGGYITCKIMDSESLYIQHGGAFPTFLKSVYVVPGYLMWIDMCMKDYKRISTKVKADNVAMIKLAFKAGFCIVGTTIFKNELYVELTKEE